MTPARSLLRIALVLLSALLPAVVLATSSNHDPDAARIVTDDVARFWQAHDEAGALADAARRSEVHERRYLQPGSAGLQAFVRLRIGSSDQLAKTIAAHPRYYAALRTQTADLAAREPAIRAPWRRLAELVPEAVFPDVYLLVGRMNSGGTLTDTGLLVGLEMYGRGPDTPLDELGDWHRAVIGTMDMLPHIVAHELVHYQQRPGRVQQDTLLAAALREGSADFVAELISGRHINAHVHAWADPRAAQLWSEFERVMLGSELAPWLYGGTPVDGRPADLGYWIGYRLSKSFHQRANDKQAALRALLQIDDPLAFVKAAGGAAAFE